jgi:catechol 2,3-dioxygenase-like lactoylglutathione lyase family enzyme
VLVGLDHVQLACPPGGEPAGIDFYAGLLGLTHVPKPEPLASRGGCWFRSPAGFELHLGVEADFRPAVKAHPALLVDDLDALAAALEAAGHGVRWDTDLPDVRRCYVDDPFGNRIELIAAP